MDNIYEEIDTVYSNFDHSLKKEVAKKLKSGKFYAQHPAWDFYGRIYFKDGKWKEEVWRHGSMVELREDDDLESLISDTNDEYGHG